MTGPAATGREVPFAGQVDAAFAPLEGVFRSNFTPGADGSCDLGAALCVIVDGRVVVDCWAGWRDIDASRPWESDTLVNAYSVLKPVTAVVALSLVERALLGLDTPVASLWPEFARAGKEAVTLRQVLAHRAGLPAARRVLADDALYDWDAMCDALAESEPWWEPGTAHGYHVNTFGFLVGEPVRRTTGMQFAGALRDLVTGPLDLDIHLGVARRDIARLAEVDAPAPATSPGSPTPPGPAAGVEERRQMLLHTYLNPPGLSGIGTVNSLTWRRAVIPSTNGHATARGVAEFYSALLPGARRPLLSSDTLREAIEPHSDGHDLILDRQSRFGLGFTLHMDTRPVGVTASAFGHYGYGGSLGFADPDAGIAFAYLINRPGDRWQNPRTRGLLEAVRACS